MSTEHESQRMMACRIWAECAAPHKYKGALPEREIIRLRGILGLTQAELARCLDVSTRQVVRWEAGDTPAGRIVFLALRYLIERQARENLAMEAARTKREG